MQDTATMQPLTKDNWPEVARQKRQSLQDLIPEDWRLPADLLSSLPVDVSGIAATCGVLSDEELDITNEGNVSVLLRRLHTGELSAVQVTRAYCKRAAVAHQLVNCLHEIYFDEALRRAEELDAYYKSTGKLKGPLHGLPISLKDQFDIEGKEITMGFASWLGRISKKSAAIVKLLLDAGAIIYVRTAVPQTLMHGETGNHVFGRTVNPYHSSFTPGGSSGGEGALLALKGSLGIGTDIGGSVRIPAGFCGLYALRPCYHRIPYGHASNSWLGQISIHSVIGPMARSLEGLGLFFKTILDMQPANYDATALPFPFRPAHKALSQLAFGVISTDGIRTPHPPIQRALDVTVKAVREAGHEVVEFPIEAFKRIPDVNYKILFADGGEDFRRTAEAIDEPLHDLTEFVIEGEMEAISVYEMHQLNQEKEDLQQQFLSQWLDTKTITSTGRPLDGLICPIGPSPACQHGHMDYDNYTSLFNVLDLPAVAFPVTRVDKQLDQKAASVSLYDKMDKRSWDRYDADLADGLPVGLQLVGRRYQEEATLSIASIVEEALKR